MAYSATLANNRKLISDAEHRRLLNLFSRAGLSMDHHQFDETMLAKATAAIVKTRDGQLRAAVPSPIGSCTFLNDVTEVEMNDALNRHKELMKEYPRNGEGLEAYVDASDTGYTENAKMEEEHILVTAARKAGELNGVNGRIGAAAGDVHDGLARMNEFVNSTRPLSNGIGSRLSNVYLRKDESTWNGK